MRRSISVHRKRSRGILKSSFDLSVPATSANLGPGFDTIGVALDLRLRAQVRPSSGFTLDFVPGPAAPTHDGFAREFLRGFDAIAKGNRPPLAVLLDNPIPLGKGLGSSAAAGVLGARIAAECFPYHSGERGSEAALPSIVTALEGHPDNALPALLGGVVIAAQCGEKEPSYLRFVVPARLRAVIVIPEIDLPTEEARAVLPQSYRRQDVVYNLQRSSLLAAALASGDLAPLRVAMEDRLHQPYRAAAVPGLTEALKLKLPGLLGVALSGAGPSLIGFVEANADAVASELQAVFTRHQVRSSIMVLGLTNVGARITAPVAECAP
jgi:homoserine kinase